MKSVYYSFKVTIKTCAALSSDFTLTSFLQIHITCGVVHCCKLSKGFLWYVHNNLKCTGALVSTWLSRNQCTSDPSLLFMCHWISLGVTQHAYLLLFIDQTGRPGRSNSHLAFSSASGVSSLLITADWPFKLLFISLSWINKLVSLSPYFCQSIKPFSGWVRLTLHFAPCYKSFIWLTGFLD